MHCLPNNLDCAWGTRPTTASSCNPDTEFYFLEGRPSHAHTWRSRRVLGTDPLPPCSRLCRSDSETSRRPERPENTRGPADEDDADHRRAQRQSGQQVELDVCNTDLPRRLATARPRPDHWRRIGQLGRISGFQRCPPDDDNRSCHGAGSSRRGGDARTTSREHGEPSHEPGRHEASHLESWRADHGGRLAVSSDLKSVLCVVLTRYQSVAAVSNPL